MKDLTSDSIPKLICEMAAPIAAGMIFQTLYFLIDLYFVAGLGNAALAGVGAGGVVMFIVFALTQVLGVGTTTLIAHAVGRKDRADAIVIFNQSLMLSATCALVVLALGYAFAGAYMRALGSDADTRSAGIDYLYWYLPGLGLQFALVAMSSALRGTGIVKPAMLVQMLTVVINAVLAPVLIAGWGTSHPLGVVGAALASTVSVAVGVLLLAGYFRRLEKYVEFDGGAWRPRRAAVLRLMRVGLPAGGEFALMFIFMSVMYWIIRPFGAAAQAGFGVGVRVMQGIFLPAMAVAFATAPIAGQNFAAGKFDRVRQTFAAAAVISSLMMFALTSFSRWQAAGLIHFFTADPAAVAVGTGFLQIISWNFVASGVIFTCSGLFQGLGHTLPAVYSAASRLLTFVLPALWLAAKPQFRLESLWYVSVLSVALQALFSLWLVRGELRRRLPAGLADAMPPRVHQGQG
ncbi:MAG: MATE family efflux transporter [Steroidobacteraceae bacterium]|jgi:putative MATE family efflux protein